MLSQCPLLQHTATCGGMKCDFNMTTLIHDSMTCEGLSHATNAMLDTPVEKVTMVVKGCAQLKKLIIPMTTLPSGACCGH